MPSTPQPGSGEFTHAGTVVYRIRDGTVQYLLVGPSNGADEWVLPKGHIEAEEDARETAARELREEAGVIARLICPVGSVEFQTNRETVRARFFLMEKISETSAIEARKTRWFPFQEALTRATHDGSKQLLQAAEAARSRLSGEHPRE